MSQRILKISQIYKISKIKIVSFDFDDTLRGSDFGNPIKENVNKLLGHSRAGDDVYVVTAREDNEKNREEIGKFLDENGLAPFVKKIILVGGLKKDTLVQIGASQHYDDKDHEIEALKGTGIIGIRV